MSPQVGGGVRSCRLPPVRRGTQGLDVWSMLVFCGAVFEVGGDEVVGVGRAGAVRGGELFAGGGEPGGEFGIACGGFWWGSGQGVGFAVFSGHVTYPVGDDGAGGFRGVEVVGGLEPQFAGVQSCLGCFGPGVFEVGQGCGVGLEVVGVGEGECVEVVGQGGVRNELVTGSV